ncbi:MAG TPA: hypothetical protein VLV76_22380 [Candidatus Acidoferrum sp.]|nr:hypothetical protein [Candidatus Acidoferrum sp.]
MQVERIVACPEFDASERNRRFLEYVVGETLAGRTERIKAYSIATSVFGRDVSFDPQSDPIIRIEAGRLRRSLERYYLTAGKHDPIRIEIPKGSYVPTFRSEADDTSPGNTSNGLAAALPPATIGAARSRPQHPPWRRQAALAGSVLAILLLALLGIEWFEQYSAPAIHSQPALIASHGPAIFVVPFSNDGQDAADDALIRGFTREVIVGLMRFDGLLVYGPETSFRYGLDGGAEPSVRDIPVEFLVSGGVTIANNRFQVIASLSDAKTGRNLWSDKFEGDLTAGDILQARDSLADRVVQVLAQPYGVIFHEQTKEIEGKPPASFTSYQCMLEFYNYWRSLSLSLHARAQECLERVVAQEPDYAEAYSALAMVYANIYRYGFNPDGVTFDPLPKALELARHAVALAPDSVQGYKALHLVYWLMHDVNGSFQAAERGLALNPNDSEIMADLGGRLCLVGNWERGLPLVQEAFARNPAQPGLYRIVTSLRFYLDGNYEEALSEIEKANIPSVIHYHVILAMTHAQLGQMKQAAAEVKEILKIDPAYGENVVADLKKHNVYPDLIRAVVDGLHKAGLSGGQVSADRAS